MGERQLIENYIEDVIKLVAEKESFVEYTIHDVQESKKGESFTSSIIKLTVRGVKRDGLRENLKIVIKRALQDEQERENINIVNCHANEVFVYNEIIPALYKIQHDIGMKSTERFNVPRSLWRSTELGKELIVMEDLATAGFKKPDPMKSLDYHHLRLMILKIANFHGTAFSLKHKYPETYQNLSRNNTTDVFYRAKMTNPVAYYVQEAVRYAIDIVTDPKSVELLKRTSIGLIEKLDYWTSKKAAEPYDVLCHGDFWMGNFFYKYNEDDVPVDVSFFDWQVFRCGSLFTDLQYMIFVCTDSATRKKYNDHIFEWYYSDLGDVLNKFGLDMSVVYPKVDFERDKKKFSTYAMAVAVGYAVLMTAAPDNVPTVEEFLSGNAKGMEATFKKLTPSGRKRIQEIALDYISYGYP